MIKKTDDVGVWSLSRSAISLLYQLSYNLSRISMLILPLSIILVKTGLAWSSWSDDEQDAEETMKTEQQMLRNEMTYVHRHRRRPS